ncbi:MAG: glycosyltransferase [Desulfohalobiaceae bacterium]|nr:glycosyltransferase [Desulfohalobiaceae bacterium]
MTELVSVLLPTYNDSFESLKKSINSILGQTYRNLELLAIDDGSLQPFSGIDKIENDSRITWIYNASNCGVAFSRNIAGKHAQGEYLSFLDAGDWWDPKKLEKQLDLFKKSPDKLALVFCGARFYPQGSVPYVIKPHRHTDWVKALLISQPIVGSTSAVLLQKDIFEKLGGFYEQNDIAEDRDLWLRIAKIREIDFVSEPLTNIVIDYETGQSRSSDPEKKLFSYKRFLELHESELKTRGLKDQAIASYHVAIAQRFFLKNEIKKGIQETFRSLRHFFIFRAVLRCLIALLALLTGIPYRRWILFFRSRILHRE